jgi:sugar/nucleoside kinase (ribokinase family)
VVRFVAVGDVMLDVVCAQLPAPGTRVHADVAVRAGGSAVNAAVAAIAAGAGALVVGRIGSDPPGDLVEAAVIARGIEGRLARDAELPTGSAVALGVAPATVVANRGANARLAPDDVPAPLDGDALLVSGFALFQRGSADAARAALERFSGEWAGIDLGSPKLAAAAAGELEELAHGATVVLATAEEARAVTGADEGEAAHILSAQFRVACVKLGDGGALAATEGRIEHASVAPVKRTSPFGAGDAFGATLLVALAQADPLARALERACAAGAAAASA